MNAEALTPDRLLLLEIVAEWPFFSDDVQGALRGALQRDASDDKSISEILAGTPADEIVYDVRRVMARLGVTVRVRRDPDTGRVMPMWAQPESVRRWVEETNSRHVRHLYFPHD